LCANLDAYAVFFCFFSSGTEEKKAPGRVAAGTCSGGIGGRRLFPGKSPLPDPPEKRIWGRVFCTGRGCRFAVVSFCVPTWMKMRSSFASFLLPQKKRRPPAGLAAGASCGGKAGEGFSPGKAPSRTLPKSVYREDCFVQKRDCRFAVGSFCTLTCVQMRSSFASFLLTQKKRRPPAGLAAGAGRGGYWREKAFPRGKPPPAPVQSASGLRGFSLFPFFILSSVPAPCRFAFFAPC